MKNYKLVLASLSPRRREILERFGYRFKVITPGEEEPIKGMVRLSEEEPLRRAIKKASRLDLNVDEVAITADTLVYRAGYALGKPGSIEEAKVFLRLLGGGWHSVITGVVLKTVDGEITLLEKTRVHMKELDEREIDWIIKRDMSLDKAGAYAIQGVTGLFIDRIEGCYYNVVGLPMPKLYTILKENFDIAPENLEDNS